MRGPLPVVTLVLAAATDSLCFKFPSHNVNYFGRRQTLATAAAATVSLASAPLAAVADSLGTLGKPTVAKNPAKLKPEIVLILRVQEATSQETRLVKTGKYKELQRLNIKRAVGMMLDNYDLRDRFVRASAYAPGDKQQQALLYGQTAVESLIQILEYFPQDLQANSLSPEQTKFVLGALGSVSKSIDSFLAFMPDDVVESAREQVKEENDLNEQEYPKDEKILNLA